MSNNEKKYDFLKPRRRNCEYAVVAIQNNGPKIPQTHFRHIFDKYYSTKAYGTGLGLSIVISVIEEHGGFIIVQSTEEQTTFKLCFPIFGKDEFLKKQKPKN